MCVLGSSGQMGTPLKFRRAQKVFKNTSASPIAAVTTITIFFFFERQKVHGASPRYFLGSCPRPHQAKNGRANWTDACCALLPTIALICAFAAVAVSTTRCLHSSLSPRLFYKLRAGMRQRSALERA